MDWWAQIVFATAGAGLTGGIAFLFSVVYARGYENGYRDGRETWRQH